MGDTVWKCDLVTYECSKAPSGDAPADVPSSPGARARFFQGGPDGEDQGPGGSRRSPDGKWTAFIKDHDVHVRPAGGSEPVRLSTDGKEGLAYGRLSWSPDSKTLAAFRIEPCDRKEVYLIQSSPPGGGRAKFRARPYPLPGDKFTAYELNLFDLAGKKQSRPSVDRIDYDHPHLRWNKDGRHFTYEKVDRGHASSPGTSEAGTCRSSMSKSGLPVWRSNRKT
jgi:Dipeptidyl peptidase IV (DPP IV) N-terminal region